MEQSQNLQAHLREYLPLAEEVELIVASPMRRTLQTTLIGLGWLVERGVKTFLDAGWQETLSKPCDTGTPIPLLSKEYPTLDFSMVDPIYPNKTSPPTNRYASTKRALLARGQVCLHDLYRRPEKVIAVVSHSGFMDHAVTGAKWANADYRIFEFDQRTGESVPYRLVEWEQTKSNGGGLGLSSKDMTEVGSGIKTDEGTKQDFD